MGKFGKKLNSAKVRGQMPYIEQVLEHVAAEVFEQCDLLGHALGKLVDCHGD